MALGLSKPTDRITVRDVDLDPDGDAEVSYILRPLTAQVAAKIRAKGGRAQEEVIYALLDHCLESWTGVELDGQPAPCTRDMKLMLPLTIASALVDRASSRLVQSEADKADSFRPS